ncbi:MAG: polyribonucleotide nucleotidyltransferase [Verrucomicrobia bacterium]|jgi:polyribonucleotide nucleotidyltransferase|nr:polyribonucleotide nucleotidyltransferase [Verrucomicrobiota bacterium]
MKQKHNVKVDGLDIEFATGSLAGLASGAVTIRSGETELFVSTTAASTLRPGQDFFPLTVDYREKFSAAGKFPGGYFKREGKPSEKEILTSRLCDRPLRPLFPKGFMNEVQVIGMLLSTDQLNEPDVLMVNAASAATLISDIPWNGPVGCVRVGQIDGEFVTNPNHDEMLDSDLDLIYVGTETEMLMIEGSAEFISDDRFYEALVYAQDAIQPIIAAQRELAKLAGKPKKEFELMVTPKEITDFCEEHASDKVREALKHDSYTERKIAVEAISSETIEALKAKLGEDSVSKDDVTRAFDEIQEKLYRQNIMETGRRVDGRGVKDLRTISCETGTLPRVHGSAIFNRGETQALVITTLGTSRDTQDIDGITGGARTKSFILHYNFPPFSTGEAGRFGFTSRREQGHGALAERSLLPILPPEDEFPYSIRIVSEVMSSNGSTSMASICGGCLSLMDAGVPITAPCAGISTGLVTEQDENGKITKHVCLTDILGAEDHFGDMDFKVAGSPDGITGFQLDLKIRGLPFDIALEAIKQNRDARMKILGIMAEHMPESRKELREHAPRITTIKIAPDKIGALIGPGGKNIRRITEVSGAQVDINDEGNVLIFATDKESMDRAVQEVDACTAEIEVGKTYRGIVRGVKDFGAFVECLPGKEGLVHISELADFRVNKTEDICKLGDEMVVKCIGVEKGKVRLSRKAALEEAKEAADDASEETAAESSAE